MKGGMRRADDASLRRGLPSGGIAGSAAENIFPRLSIPGFPVRRLHQEPPFNPDGSTSKPRRSICA